MPESLPVTNGLLDQSLQALSHHPAYEVRPDQQHLMANVAEALATQQPLLAEAGTGLGKTLAYLLPTLLAGQGPVVVSTATIALQEQLLNKELPFLNKVLATHRQGKPLAAKLVKGRSHYLCIHKLEELAQASSGQPAIKLQLNTLRNALDEGWQGDRAELEWGIPDTLWQQVASRHDDCLGWRCPFYQENPYRQAREALQKCDIIITNHALYAQDLATGGGVLPPHPVVVFDEAHHLPKAVQHGLSVRLSRAHTSRLLQTVEKQVAPLPQGLLNTVLQAEAGLLNWLLARHNGRTTWRLTADTTLLHHLETMATTLAEVHAWLEALLPEPDSPAEDGGGLATSLKTTRHAQRLEQVGQLQCDWQWLAESSPQTSSEGTTATVLWAELDANNLHYTLTRSPLSVAPFLRQTLWKKTDVTPILTSATLSVNGSLHFMANELGLAQPLGEGGERSTTLVSYPSPFDYRKQAELYLPPPHRFPDDPNAGEAYTEAVATEILALIERSQGHALALFTSTQAMQRAANWVIPQTQLPIRVQGDWPKHKLLAWFSATPGAVLFATASFWEGIDLPGQQLRCVIIDKIPFTSPEEPLHQARVEELKQQGGDWFKGYALPMALLRLKQGVGRLIRTQSDEGLLALLDPRLQTKGYGKTLLAQLPPMRPLTSLAKPLPLT